MTGARVTDEFSYRGIDTVILENENLRIVSLPGKGSDVVEFRDKRADIDLLFDSPHNWQSPGGSYQQSKDTGTAWLDHYPGGWQECLPMGGVDPSSHGAEYGLHGESPLMSWDYDLNDENQDSASVTFSTELVRYPFAVEKTFTLENDSCTLRVSEEVRNEGAVELPYVWLHHIAYGLPLISEAARIDLPDAEVSVDETPQGESPLEWGSSFDWPHSTTGVNLAELPPTDSGIQDLSYIHDYEDGWYALTNSDVDLGIAVSFDESLFESIWMWRSFGGFEGSPFFGRERVVGLELCTGWPSSDVIDSQGEDGTETLKTLSAGESVETEFEMSTYRGVDRVDSYESALR